MSATTFDLQPVSFTAPTPDAPFMTITFRLPHQSGSSRGHDERDPIHPATGLQVSFVNKEHEVFLERLTSRDVTPAGSPTAAATSGSGSGDHQQQLLLWSASIPEADMPTFLVAPGTPETETLVRLHAWRGEKLLGSWDVGGLAGRERVRD